MKHTKSPFMPNPGCIAEGTPLRNGGDISRSVYLSTTRKSGALQPRISTVLKRAAETLNTATSTETAKLTRWTRSQSDFRQHRRLYTVLAFQVVTNRSISRPSCKGLHVHLFGLMWRLHHLLLATDNC